MIHHSDRGSQYTSISFGQRLKQAGVLPSMGSLAESFVATIKRELVERRSWPTREEVRSEIFEFVEDSTTDREFTLPWDTAARQTTRRVKWQKALLRSESLSTKPT